MTCLPDHVDIMRVASTGNYAEIVTTRVSLYWFKAFYLISDINLRGELISHS